MKRSGKRTMLLIAETCLWTSLAIGLLGFLITFAPGAETWWYGLAALLAIPGLIIPKWHFKTVPILLVVCWSAIALSGYFLGKEYQEWMEENLPEEVLRKFE